MKEMLKAVLNGQHALKSELLGEISKLEKKQDRGFVEVNKKFDEVNKRLDKQDAQLAYL